MIRLWRCLFILIPVLWLAPAGRTAPAAAGTPGVYDVRAFGATGDGTTLDTAAVNAAISAAASAGGGEVRFPAGNYLCGSIHLASDITLYIDAGATIVAAGLGNGGAAGPYDAAEPNPTAHDYQDFGHTHWRNSLIWGDGLQNISIIGPGRIFGRGLDRDENGAVGRGNKSISLKLCRNVTLRDFTIQHGGWFGILATGVDNLTVNNLKIDTNRDGMDIDCCRNVRVSDCSVNSPSDDGICLKSSYGLGFARATENVTITNCQVSGYDEGTLLDGTLQHTNRSQIGRIKFGTESNGGFENITVSNCTFAYCRGLALEDVDGGKLEDVAISNITMRNVFNSPIYVRLGSRLRGPSGTVVGDVARVSISHVIAYNADPRSCAIVSGIPNYPIQNITFSDIEMWYRGGGTAAEAARVPPELANGYPEPDMLGEMPAYGFFLRHVSGVTMRGIQLHTLTDDQRPPFALDDVAGVNLSGIDAQRAAVAPTFAMTGVTGLTVSQSVGVPDKQAASVPHGTL